MRDVRLDVAARRKLDGAVVGEPLVRLVERPLIPYGRIGETDAIGPPVAWLVSDDADYIPGTTLFVDGGMLPYPGFRTGG